MTRIGDVSPWFDGQLDPLTAGRRDLAPADPPEPIFAALAGERGDPYSRHVHVRKLVPVVVAPEAPPIDIRSMPAELAAQLRADLDVTAATDEAVS